MPLKFIPEMADGSRNRPGSRIAERTNGIAFYAALNIPQQIYIVQFAFAKFYIFQNLFHPASAFATRRALSAAFVTVEAGQCKCMTHYALILIKHNKTAAAHHAAGCKTTIAQAFIVHDAGFAF